MIILALDTSLSSCSVAIVRDGKVLSEKFENRSRGHAERLMPMAGEVCAQASLNYGDLDYIAVTRGPGTFTGVRIGLAAAKGLALALNIPLIGATSLEIVARQAVEALGEAFTGQLAVAHDARRSEVYLQIFEKRAGQLFPVTEPRAVPLAKVADHLTEKVTMLVGTGVALVRPFLPDGIGRRLAFPAVETQPKAATLAKITHERLLAGESPDKVSPLYLRAPDAIAARPISYPFQNQ